MSIYILALGQVSEILQAVDDSVNIEHRKPSLILLQLLQVGAPSPIYLMPRLKLLQKFCVIAYKPFNITDILQDLFCTVNTQHHCHGNNCSISEKDEIQQQEHVNVRVKIKKYNHGNPSDIVLNTAQMRDYAHILPFTTHPLELNRVACIQNGAEQEFNFPSNKKSKQNKWTQSLLQQITQTKALSSGVAILQRSGLRNEVQAEL
ncbi:hypothetical protein GYMLUDRAFT_59758 [Collybiopsis luxurians FD-317 M1]|uniref:Uncharacterized protein n=1 Tax=Collybiopsis luxurians FD-317 M1 TaxID=944289 RepID=A0A0D0BWR2_9AGAR|nr:hypothetical protein GYMLUDRAFT_59758 [Collybiopsis luxurians FD-317 M1]